MTTDADPRIAKLPRWAQDHINLLTRRVEDVERDMQRLQDGSRILPARQHFTLDTLSSDDGPYWLPPYSRLDYHADAESLDPGIGPLSIRASDEHTGISVMSNGSHRGRLVVIPQVSNAVTIALI